MKWRPQSTANREGGSRLEQGEVAMDDPHIAFFLFCNGDLLFDMLAGEQLLEENVEMIFQAGRSLHVEDLGGNLVSTWGQHHPTFNEALPVRVHVSGSRRPEPPCSCISLIWHWSCHRNRALIWRGAWWGRSTASVRSRGSSGAPGNNDKDSDIIMGFFVTAQQK